MFDGYYVNAQGSPQASDVFLSAGEAFVVLASTYTRIRSNENFSLGGPNPHSYDTPARRTLVIRNGKHWSEISDLKRRIELLEAGTGDPEPHYVTSGVALNGGNE